MNRPLNPNDIRIDIYVEIGQTRTIAAALDWPGWCRAGRDEASALGALIDYGPRYARVLEATDGTALGFTPPADIAALVIKERPTGSKTTDFGAPDVILAGDSAPVDAASLSRWQGILEACWRAFDSAVEAAAGKTLRTGPRGGGRDLAKIAGHVYEVDAAYLGSLGGKLKPEAQDDPAQALAKLRQAILTTLAASVRGEIPARGPRGGVRWPPRYFVRRLAWHVLDHVWEIEDRAG